MTARLSTLALAIVAALVTASTGVAAQPVEEANVPASEPDRSNPFEGRVLAYLLSPDARVAGLLFDEGRQVVLPPDAGVRVASVIRPGMRVRVDLSTASADREPPSVSWPALTIVESGRRVTPDQPVAGTEPRLEPGDTTLTPMQVAGEIDLLLRGPRGETNGVRLADGVQVFFPPHVALEYGALLVKGTRLDVEGFGRRSEFGTAVQATVITTPTRQRIRVYVRP